MADNDAGGSGRRMIAQASSRKGCMRGKGGPENASCTYKGVRQRTWGKWVSEIREPNRGSRVWLGTYDSARDAAIAYDAAARKLYGPNARLNLPDEVATLPKPSRPTAQQRAAAVDHAAAAQARYNQQMKMKQEFQKQVHIYMQKQKQKQMQEVKTESLDDDQNVGAYDSMMSLSLGNYGYTCDHHDRTMNHDERVGENEVGPQVFTRNLIANLPEFDDSGMWAEAVSTMDYQSQAIGDPGIAAPAYDAIGIELSHPLML